MYHLALGFITSIFNIMYKPILIFLLLLFGCLQAKSDQDFSFIRTKYGITLYINSNDVKSQQKSWLDLENTLDSLLENLASVAPGRDTNQKIKILVHTKEHTSWLKNDTRVPYITLAYDTLNDVDFKFFKAYSDSVVKTLIRNVYYKSRIVATYYEKGHIPVPLSIHSGNLKLPVVVGLKLVFNPDTAVNWREIKNLLKYGLSNKEEVKRDQKLLTVKFGFDKNLVTLVELGLS